MVNLEWAVRKVTLDELQKCLNDLENDGFEIDKYEKLAEEYDGIKFVVVAFKNVRWLDELGV